MKETRGRPKLPKAEKRQVYTFRLSQQEIRAYNEAAKRADLTLPAWIRKALTKAVGNTIS
jgi:predicted HicB family RNase H-like nuclease